MIPKTIHYCWFGGNPLPEFAEKCIASWKKYCPDYTITEWNETNYEINKCPEFVQQAYKAGKWAFVSDYARLQIIYEHGGVYLDTDVELVKNIDILLKNTAYFGFDISANQVNTGLGFGAESETPILYDLMLPYHEMRFTYDPGALEKLLCNKVNSKVFLHYGLVENGLEQNIKGNVHVYPSDYFCPIDFRTGELNLTKNSFSIHHFSTSWMDKANKNLHQLRIDYKNKYGASKGKIVYILYLVFHFYTVCIKNFGWKGTINKFKKMLKN